LRAALDRLEADTVLMRALGPTLARAYLAVKRSEAEAFGKESADFETKHHFWKF
jgi:glutamine synthetase